jgi:4-hydroxyphenylpyruvate dioxygenase
VSSPIARDYELKRFNHIVGNVPELAPVAAYVAGFTGFHEFTTESELNSMVLTNNSENVLLPLNESVHDTKRRNLIQTYLDHHGGPGVQHMAMSADDMLGTLREMRAPSAMVRFEFLAQPLPSYYDGVRRRGGDVLSEAQIKALFCNTCFKSGQEYSKGRNWGIKPFHSNHS